ncbi:MAG: OB-fold nucleic acid binding domain-containing protein [Kineosporiaceae bacterium]
MAGDGSDNADAEAERSRRRAWAGLAASDAEWGALERRRRADRWGGGRLDSLPGRCRATVCGTLRSVRLCPSESSCTLEAELCDGTGTVLLVWLGRRRVPGLEPGRSLRVHGTITERDGQRVMYNPRYDLLPVDA